MLEITVENVEQTIRKMAQYNVQKDKEFNEVVKKYAKEITKRAKANAPVGKTKNLKNSIRVKSFRKQGPAATVFPRKKYKGHHRHLVEYGTTTRYHKKNGKFVGWARKQPFMKPAQDSVMPQYLAEIKKVVDKNDTI